MHRSGTSAIAGVLQTLGLHFGDSEQAIPTTDANPKGYWERQDVMAVNDAILAKIGCQWDRLHRYHPDRIKEIYDADLESRIRDILSQLDRAPAGFLKDPRLCLTFPIWERVATPVTVIWIIRHPLSVARSLEARMDCSLPTGLAMWELYNRAIATLLGNRPRIVVDFEAFQADPVTGARSLAEQLAAAGLALKESIDQHGLQQWFDRDLVRQRPGEDDDGLVPDGLRSWYRNLLTSAATPDPAVYQLSPTSKVLLNYHDLKIRRDEEALRALTQERDRLAWDLRKATDRHARLASAQQAFLSSRTWRVVERTHRLCKGLSGQPGAKSPMDKVRDILRENDPPAETD